MIEFLGWLMVAQIVGFFLSLAIRDILASKDKFGKTKDKR